MQGWRWRAVTARGWASVAGRAGQRRVTSLIVAAQCLLAILALAGCALPDVEPGASVDTVPRPTRTATATPLPWKGAPHQLPRGWTAYYAPHFTIALPPGWQVNPIWLQKDPNPKWWHMRYVLSAPEQDLRVAVEEWDDLSVEDVRDDFCAPTATYETRTIAGLSLRFSQGLGAMGTGRHSASERDWMLISNQRIVYEIWVDDGTPGLYAEQRKSQNTAVVGTFAPQYATWGCA